MTHWRILRNKLNIDKNEVHIWKIKIPFHLFDGVDINIDSTKNRPYILYDNKLLNLFRKVINEEEIKSSIRFYRISDQIRSISTRYVLKKLISDYIKLNPSFIQFFYNEYSKPFLCQSVNPISLQFNVTHAGDYIALAFTRDTQIGIDIELHDYKIDKQSLVRHVFSEDEELKWQKLSEIDKIKSFYHVWSCKEAILKGIGVGLSYMPINISLEINPNKQPVLFHLKDCNFENDFSSWDLCDFHIQNNYSAIFAIRKKEYRTTFYEWSWDDFILTNLL